MKIPSNRQWTQDSAGENNSILSSTTNMSMDTMGKATLSRKAVSVFNNGNDSDFKYVMSIDYVANAYMILTSGDIFKGTLPDYSFTKSGIGTTPSTGLNSDALIFNNLYTVSTDTSLYTWNGSTTWTDRSVSLTTSVPHPLAVFGVQLAIGNGNTVKLISNAYATNITLTLPTEFQVTTLRAVNNFIYIGTKNLNGDNAKIFVWNGDTTLFDYECEVGASWVFSMTPYLSTVAAITSEGQLGVVNGTNFQELAGLPVYFNPHARWQGSGGLTLNGKVFHRGMCTIGDNIYLNIEGDVDSGFMPEMQSGIWVYDPVVGLYHRTSYSSDVVVNDSALTLSDNTITTASPHLLKTGDAVSFESIDGLVGVNNDDSYFVTVISATEIKLSQSRKAVQRGDYVTITGTPTVGDTLVYSNNTNFGAYGNTSGAIISTIYSQTPHTPLTSEILWGARCKDIDGTTFYSLFSFMDSYNVGSFTTQRKYSDNVEQTWKEIYNFVDGISLDTEKVIVKLQTKYEPTPKLLQGTWLSTNQLNSSTSEDYTAWSDIEDGYEIVIIDGYGRGQTAHVTSIDRSGGTVSLTLDENIGTINETCDLYYTTFKKAGGSLSVDNKIKEKVRASVANSKSPWIALKIELRGYSSAVNMVELSNVVHSNTN